MGNKPTAYELFFSKRRFDKVKVGTNSTRLKGIWQMSNECIWFSQASNEDRFYMFGIGTVAKIKKGVDFDIVYINFGQGFGGTYLRKVICKTTNARKQIYTLKINQITLVYGQGQFSTQIVQKNATRYTKKAFYGLAFFPAYVPLAFDIENTIAKEDKDRIEELLVDDPDTNECKDFLAVFEKK